MAGSIRSDASQIIVALANYGQVPGDSQQGRYGFDGDELRDLLGGWDPDRINDAVGFLRNTNLVEIIDALGTHPFSFASIELTTHGRAAAQDAQQAAAPPAPATSTPDHPSATSDDRKFAALAIELSRKCMSEAGKVSPKVGAVVVKDGKVLATAYRGEIKAGQHAEYIALEEKLGNEILARSSVYTTLEPCTTRNHPKVPCAEWLIDRRVARVVIGMLDPNPAICGKGQRLLRHASITTDLFPEDLMAQVEELNREFTRSQHGNLTAATKPHADPAPASDSARLSGGSMEATFDWANAREFLHAELVSPVVYRSSKSMKFNVRLRTIQRTPAGMSIRRWKVTRILMDWTVVRNARYSV